MILININNRKDAARVLNGQPQAIVCDGGHCPSMDTAVRRRRGKLRYLWSARDDCSLISAHLADINIRDFVLRNSLAFHHLKNFSKSHRVVMPSSNSGI
jgi:hypothetical protein